MCCNFAQPNYDESKVPDYQLPELLLTVNGKTVSNKEEWENTRRQEILNLFKEEVYGKMPSKEVDVSFKVIKHKPEALDGKAIQKEVLATFSNGAKSISMNILIFLPKQEMQPVPVFVGMNFYGNHTIHPDTSISITDHYVSNNDEFHIFNNTATDSSRGVRVSRWPVERILERGYGLATIYYGDLDPDFDDGFKNGIHPLFYDDGQTKPKPDEWGSIGAWAWGLSRAMDYFEMDDAIDQHSVAVIGHSRLGKTSLWAGASDDRFALVISNDSGCGGAALSRRKFGETVKRINKGFPHWFCDNFNKYNNNEEDLPVDQHMLLALIAPRPMYVASAEEDKWADPKGEYLSLFHACQVYQLYDKKIQLSENPPEVNMPVISNKVGYHIRSGGHDITEYDWERYLDFADMHLKHH